MRGMHAKYTDVEHKTRNSEGGCGQAAEEDGSVSDEPRQLALCRWYPAHPQALSSPGADQQAPGACSDAGATEGPKDRNYRAKPVQPGMMMDAAVMWQQELRWPL
ncbi:hypothetical protein NDU88_009808 [Pleurodeles waltl]|uniref:Uncharacterized protein n=1 Tax=Pleurodeles waltl TaxID=8319 RepID=A0AAV7PW67_PLEWA|nr:hypothetical protein NDU88_009808 [Pleurodeles waltl]